MSVISKRFADELDDPEMRHAFVGAQTRTKLANQLRALRSQRGWAQSKLGEQLGGVPQGNVARLEDRERMNPRLETLIDLAAAFDVGLIVEFVSYPEFLIRTRDLSPDYLHVQQFSRGMLDMLCTPRKGGLGSLAVEPSSNIRREVESASALAYEGLKPKQSVQEDTEQNRASVQDFAWVSRPPQIQGGRPA